MIGTGRRATPTTMVRVALLASLLLAACGPSVDDPTAVSADEDRQLNQAAADLDGNVIGNLSP